MTEHRFVISNEALTDLTEIAIWYEKQSSYLSNKFLSEFYNFSLEKIYSNPSAFSRYTKNNSVRRYKMAKFPYKIFYDSRAFPIKIIAIIHASRSLRYIKGRLK